MEYYLQHGLEHRGPYSLDQLRTQGLSAATLVWRQGLADWTRADAVPELYSLLPPPPLPPADAPYASPQASHAWPPSVQPTRHSLLGIASFVVGLFSVAAEVIGVGLATYMVAAVQGQANELDQQSPMMIMAGLLICAGLPLNLVGVGLGLMGLFQPQRRRLFAVLGLVLNAGMLLLLGGLMAIGLAVG